MTRGATHGRTQDHHAQRRLPEDPQVEPAEDQVAQDRDGAGSTGGVSYAATLPGTPPSPKSLPAHWKAFLPRLLGSAEWRPVRSRTGGRTTSGTAGTIAVSEGSGRRRCGRARCCVRGAGCVSSRGSAGISTTRTTAARVPISGRRIRVVTGRWLVRRAWGRARVRRSGGTGGAISGCGRCGRPGWLRAVCVAPGAASGSRPVPRGISATTISTVQSTPARSIGAATGRLRAGRWRRSR